MPCHLYNMGFIFLMTNDFSNKVLKNSYQLELEPISGSAALAQCSKRQGLLEIERCFIQEAGNLGRWWTSNPKPFPTCQLEGKGFTGENGEVSGVCRTAQSAPTIILKLVMWWSGQCHLDCFKCS